MAEEQEQYIVAGSSGEAVVQVENCLDFTMEESQLLPVFKKSHISTRAIEKLLVSGDISDYSEDTNKRNALRQATQFYKMVNGELYRYGTDREYKKYGLRIVVHDDEPQKKLDILVKCHVDEDGNHCGMNNTIKRVNELYYWQGVSAHVKIFLKKCRHCKGRSKYEADTWIEEEKKMLQRKREKFTVCNEARTELKNLGRIKKPTPPETFFIVMAERKVDLDKGDEESEMLIDSNNIEYVVETLGYSEDGVDLPEVCHVFNVPDIVPLPGRYRSREIEAFLKHGVYPEDFTGNMKAGLRGPAAQYAIINDELYHEGNKKGSKGLRLVIHDDNPALKVKVMVENHLDEDGTHLGLNRTMYKISEKYFWVGLSLDVRKFMMKCKVCLLTRGRKAIDNNSKFEDEVSKLKKRQKAKHGDPSNFEQSFESYDQLEVAEGEAADKQDNVSHQIIRLVGPNEDVTEITVAVVNGEVNQTGMTEEQIAALTNATSETVVETQSEANNIESDKPAQSNQVEDKADPQVVEEQVVTESVEIDSGAGVIVSETIEADKPEIVGNTVEEATAEETSAVEAAIGMIMASEKATINDTSGTVTTETDASEETQVVEIRTEPTTDRIIKSHKSAEDQTAVDNIPPPAPNPVSKTGLFWFHKDIIYVPKSVKSRAMELYLHGNVVTSGYTTAQLEEATKNFFLEDGDLYRRASRYKRRQFVIHDDNPESKMKIIEECHVKANGKHFSEVLTVQNISYKYYWDEAKWDVHRFYIRCQKCVRDGEDVRSKKKVLTVEEHKQQAQLIRKQINETGISAKRNREYRERYKERLDKFKLWNRYGKEDGDFYAEMDEDMDDDKMEQVEAMQSENLDGTAATDAPGTESTQYNGDQDESDIEINMPDSEDEESKETDTPKTKKKKVDKEVDDPYILVLYATLAQVSTIRHMFKSHNWEYKVNKMTKYLDNDEERPHGWKDKAIYEVEMPVRQEQEKAVHKLFVEQKWDYTYEELKPANPSPVKKDPSTPQKKDPSTPPKVIKSPNKSVETPEKQTTKQKVETKSTPQRKEAATVTAKKEEGTPKCKKRPFVEVETPVTEGRRSSRREIKLPRRFGPDFEVDTPKTRGRQTLVDTPPRSATELSISPVDRRKSAVDKSKSVTTIKPHTPKRQIVDDAIVNSVTRTRQATRSATVVNEGLRLKSPVNVQHEGKGKLSPVKATKQSVKMFSSSDLVVVHDVEEKMDDESGVTVQSDNVDKDNTQIDGDSTQTDTDSSKIDKDNANVDKNNVRINKDNANEDKNSVKRDKDNASVDKKNVKINKDDENIDKVDVKIDKDDSMADNDNSKDLTKDTSESMDTSELYADEEDFYDDDDDLDDDEDDDDDDEFAEEEDVDEEEAKALAIFTDPDLPADSDEVKEFLEKGLIDICETCGKVFKKSQTSELCDHLSRHKNTDHYPCEHCSKVFTDSNCAQVHQKAHTSEKEAKCSSCQSEFHTSYMLAAHSYKEHGECTMFTCDVCNAKFVSMKFMKAEVLFDGELSFFRCVMCPK